jgi:O-antigen ligase
MMIALVMLRRWGPRVALPLVLGAALLLPALYLLSPVIRGGTEQALGNLHELSQGQRGENSLGLRVEFAHNTLKIIEQAPVLGHGTGSFRANYDGGRASHNPHNDFLWLWSEVGLLGPLGLLAVLAALVLSARELSKAQSTTVQAVALSMLIGTLGNSFFTDNVSGLGFLVIACALIAGPWWQAPASEAA